MLPLVGSFFAMVALEERVGGGYDLCRSNGQLKPIFRLLIYAYGLLGFAKSFTLETSAKEEKERDLPPKNFDRPGLLQNCERNLFSIISHKKEIVEIHSTQSITS